MKKNLLTLICAVNIFFSNAQDYCIPEYSFGPDNYNHITGISFNSLWYGTTFGEYIRTYTDGVSYTDETISVMASDWGGATFGKNYPTTLNVDVYSVDDYTILVGAWVDWNNDGDFDDINEELGIQTIYPFSGIGSASFHIDETISKASFHRVRIRSTDGVDVAEVDPCSPLVFGEAIDFEISIVEKPYCYDNLTAFPNYQSGLPLNSIGFDDNQIPINIQNGGITYLDLAPEGTKPIHEAEIGNAFELSFEFPDLFFGAELHYVVYVDHNDNGEFEDGYEEVAEMSSEDIEVTFNLTIPETYASGTHNMRIRITLNEPMVICGPDLINPGLVIDEKITLFEPSASAIQTNISSIISIYPNPATELLFIEGDHIFNYQLKIIDVTGKEVISEILQQKTILDVSQWPKGMYFVTIYSGENLISSEKIIVQ